MIRMNTPEQAPENAPRDGDILPFRRGVPRRRPNPSSRGEIEDLRSRVEKLEAEKTNRPTASLNRVRNRLRGNDNVAPAKEAQSVQGPKTLQELSVLIQKIRVQRMSETYSQQHASEVEQLYAQLAATTLGQTDYKETRPVADELERLERGESHNVSHKAERLAAIAAARNQLQPHLPLRFEELSATVSTIKSLKDREDALFESRPLPRFDGAIDRQIMDAYTALANTAFSCTPKQASVLRAELKALYKKEQDRWEYKFGPSRWRVLSWRSKDEATAQTILDDRKVMYHKRTLLLMEGMRKLDVIRGSSTMFWRTLGRAPEHLAA